MGCSRSWPGGMINQVSWSQSEAACPPADHSRRGHAELPDPVPGKGGAARAHPPRVRPRLGRRPVRVPPRGSTTLAPPVEQAGQGHALGRLPAAAAAAALVAAHAGEFRLSPPRRHATLATADSMGCRSIRCPTSPRQHLRLQQSPSSHPLPPLWPTSPRSAPGSPTPPSSPPRSARSCVAPLSAASRLPDSGSIQVRSRRKGTLLTMRGSGMARWRWDWGAGGRRG